MDETQLNRLVKTRLTTYLKQQTTRSEKEKKRWLFTAWTYFTRYSSLKKQYSKLLLEKQTGPGEKIVVKQKLEVFDGTFDVWTSIRKSLVNWAYELFLASNEPSINRMR